VSLDLVDSCVLCLASCLLLLASCLLSLARCFSLAAACLILAALPYSELERCFCTLRSRYEYNSHNTDQCKGCKHQSRGSYSTKHRDISACKNSKLNSPSPGKQQSEQPSLPPHGHHHSLGQLEADQVLAPPTDS
jgi:hypothetical protein